jgi:putative transposase
VFFSPSDYASYIRFLAAQARRFALEIWAYCLMPNHVHLIVVPSNESALSRPLGEAHRRYARLINERFGWRGHLWQERFGSFPMDEPHLIAAIRYVLLNPVRAGLVEKVTDWPYSSGRAHIQGASDLLVDTGPVANIVPDWDEYLSIDNESLPETEAFRTHGCTGRPLGSSTFVKSIEEMTGRYLRPRKPGRKASVS